MRHVLFGNALAMTALMLTLVTAPAALAEGNKPAAAEINKARGECAAQKQKFRALEAKSDPDSPALSSARLAWEHACGQAQALIDAAEGRAAPPIVAPRPVVELPPVPAPAVPARAVAPGQVPAAADTPQTLAPEPPITAPRPVLPSQ